MAGSRIATLEKKSAENSISKKGKGAMEGGVGAIGSEGEGGGGSRSWGEKAMGARQRKKQNTSKMKRMKEQSLAARARKTLVSNSSSFSSIT